jgi:hypothetical protein
MTSVHPYPLVSNLIERLGDWLIQRRQLNELGALDSGEFRRMAHELGLAPSDLDTIVRKGVNGAEELPQMLRALGFDEAAIARIQPPDMMEMRHACASCAHKRGLRRRSRGQDSGGELRELLRQCQRHYAAGPGYYGVDYSPTSPEMLEKPAK